MAAWLDLLVDTNGWTLVDTGRLETLVSGIRAPQQQYPSILYFVGSTSRYEVLRALFPHNNLTRRGTTSFLRLHLSTETANAQYPVFFAESNFLGDFIKNSKSPCRWPNQNLRHYPMNQGFTSVRDIYSRCISDFILPWTHVLCLFVENSDDAHKVRQFLKLPRVNVQVGGQRPRSTLQVLVVLRNAKLPWNFDEFRTFLLPIAADIKVTIVDLRERSSLSPTAEIAPLQNQLFTTMSQVRYDQLQNGLLFSGAHLCVLWKRKLEQGMGIHHGSVLDCLAVARENKQLNIIREEHISDFIRYASTCGYKEEQIHSFLASAFLMNAYPPQMHGFKPEFVFKELYEVQLVDALRLRRPITIEHDKNAVLGHFIHLWNGMRPQVSSSKIRQEILREIFNQYGGLNSTTSCFFCLSRYPEHMMPCLHSICDTCMVIFGRPSKKAEYEYTVAQCPICDEQIDFSICQLPPTKRPVIISLDGGGIRGIIQLGLLNALEKRVGSLKGIVDLYVGTSVGALNVMDIAFNGSSAEDSFRRFPSLAREIFTPSRSTVRQPFSYLTQCLQFLAGILSDGQYDDQNLDNILKTAVGEDRRIFDVGTTSSACARIAIITSQISDGKACVLANYRGVGIRSIKSAYRFLIPQTMNQNPFLWQVARCSVAAPWFFKAKTLPGFGTLQDGGVRANNPLSIALRESAFIWPEVENHDILISIGTGYTETTRLPRKNTGLWSLRDTAVPRLIRAAMASPSMDDEQGFFEALNYVPRHARDDIYRLDQLILEGLPRLDDVDQRRKLAEYDFRVSDSIVRSILITGCFFFELDQKPVFKQGLFHCEGSILCKSHDSKSLLRRIQEEFPGAQLRVLDGEWLGIPYEHDGCHDCGYYRKKCNFTVNNLDEIFSVEIFSSEFQQQIGGFPKSVQSFLDEQQILSSFGRIDHSVNSWPPSRGCFCSHDASRKLPFLDTPPKKRQRL